MGIQDYFWIYFYKCACWMGWHHMHDLKEAKNFEVMHAPPGLEVEGLYCCRCHHLEITKLSIDGKEAKPGKAQRLG